MKILLDTNAYSQLLRGNSEVFEIISEGAEIYLSVIVLGELFAGFHGGLRQKQNIQLLKKFLNKPQVSTISVSQYSAELFGELKYSLRKKGTPIPINDVWIAAHAVETGSILLTFDRHFEQIDGLRLRLCEV